jgi:hypothetical protein
VRVGESLSDAGAHFALDADHAPPDAGGGSERVVLADTGDRALTHRGFVALFTRLATTSTMFTWRVLRRLGYDVQLARVLHDNADDACASQAAWT